MVEICVFTLFSRLPGMASPFDTGIIYILNENRVFSCSLLETSTLSYTGNKTDAHVCDRLPPAASFGYIANLYLFMPHDLMGRELFAFICVGQSKASGR